MLRKRINKIILLTLIFAQFSFYTPHSEAQNLEAGKKTFLVTAYYSPLPDQSFYVKGSYEADIKLNGRGTNGADGTPVYTGMLAAPSSYPFGTKVKIPGLGVGEVHDRGGAIVTREGYDRIDVWMGEGDEGLSRALNWGSRLVEGEIYSDSSEIETGLDYSWVNSKLSGGAVSGFKRDNKEELDLIDSKEENSIPSNAELISKEDYNAELLTTPEPLNLKPGETQSLTLKYKNTGDKTWDKSTWLYLDSKEDVTKGEIIPVVEGKNFVVATLQEEVVAKGEIGTFILNIKSGEKGGKTSFDLKPVVNGRYKIGLAETELELNSQAPVLLAKTRTLSSTTNLSPGEKRYIEVEMQNLGDVAWTPETVTTNIIGRGIEISQKNLPSKVVNPGESTTLGLWIEAPLEEGLNSLYLRSSYNLGNNSVEIPGAVANLAINVIAKKQSEEVKIEDNRESIGGNNKLEPVLNQIPQAEERPFRVKLSHEAKNETLTADSPFVVLNESNQVLFNLSAGEKVEVKKLENGFEVKNDTVSKKAIVIRLVPQERSGVTEIMTMKNHPESNESLNDNRFRGTIEIRELKGKVTYINELPLEDYLRGLAEVDNADPMEKQKVIAVLARTYADFYMDLKNRKFPNAPYDGTDDANIFQRYLGYGSEIRSPNFANAVGATENIVVTYEGELIKTPYFSQSGGKTLSAQEKWGWTNTPYLSSVPDPWSKGLALKGHGVGLSGYGATKQAEAGKKFDEIIKYYYTGVDVSPMKN